MWILVAVGVLLVAGVVYASAARRRSVTVETTPPPTIASEAAPMSDLEATLDRVTDSAGRSLREAMDAASGDLDTSPDPDDSQPLLRHALDRVTDHGDAPAG